MQLDTRNKQKLRLYQPAAYQIKAPACLTIMPRDKQVINATREVLSGLTDDELRELSVSLNNIKKIFSKLE